MGADFPISASIFLLSFNSAFSARFKAAALVVDANLALIREAYAGVIDVTGAVAPEGATPEQREAVA